MPLLDLEKDRLACVNHDNRAGYGICRRCKIVLCDECATFLEGILTCPACTTALAAQEESALVGVGDSAGASMLVLALGLAGTTLSLYGLTILFR